MCFPLICVGHLPFFSIPLVGWLADGLDGLVAVAVAAASIVFPLHMPASTFPPAERTHKTREPFCWSYTFVRPVSFPPFSLSTPSPRINYAHEKNPLPFPTHHTHKSCRGEREKETLKDSSHIRNRFVRVHSLSSSVSLSVVQMAICSCFGKRKRRENLSLP